MSPTSSMVRQWGAVLMLLPLCAVMPRAALGQAGPPAPKVIVSNPIEKRIPRWDEFTGRFEPMEQVEVRPASGHRSLEGSASIAAWC